MIIETSRKNTQVKVQNKKRIKSLKRVKKRTLTPRVEKIVKTSKFLRENDL
jgi:hypothetical protein